MPAPPLPTSAPAGLPVAARSWRASPAALVAAGVIAYALALVATLPARVVAPRGADVAGTVWHGALALADGSVARWDWSPVQSVGSGSFAADWTIDGPGTLLTGVARLRPFGATEFAGVSGRAAWSLLAANAPGLPPGCTIPLIVALDRVSASGSRGTIRSLPGSCPAPDGPPRAVPRLVAAFDGAAGTVTPWTDRATPYATVAVAGGTVHLHVTAAGAVVFGHAGDVEFAL